MTGDAVAGAGPREFVRSYLADEWRRSGADPHASWVGEPQHNAALLDHLVRTLARLLVGGYGAPWTVKLDRQSQCGPATAIVLIGRAGTGAKVLDLTLSRYLLRLSDPEQGGRLVATIPLASGAHGIGLAICDALLPAEAPA